MYHESIVVHVQHRCKDIDRVVEASSARGCTHELVVLLGDERACEDEGEYVREMTTRIRTQAFHASANTLTEMMCNEKCTCSGNEGIANGQHSHVVLAQLSGDGELELGAIDDVRHFIRVVVVELVRRNQQ
jgi:hypothetical protein